MTTVMSAGAPQFPTPFRAFPPPIWFVSHGKAAGIAFRKLTALEAAPSLWKVSSIVVTALRG
jgi:hypothetical protein